MNWEGWQAARSPGWSWHEKVGNEPAQMEAGVCEDGVHSGLLWSGGQVEGTIGVQVDNGEASIFSTDEVHRGMLGISERGSEEGGCC